jgi:micrococcal nuclease
MESVMKKMMVLLLVGFVHFTLVAGDTVSGKVISVIDGNTLEVVTETNESYRVVLQGIDCPEIGQAFGEEARLHLEGIMLTKEITVELQGKDRWGNYIAIVFVDDLDPRIDLLNRGLAWTAEKGTTAGLKDLEERARKNYLGLWEQENPTPPWIYRRQQTMMEVKGS